MNLRKRAVGFHFHIEIHSRLTISYCFGTRRLRQLPINICCLRSTRLISHGDTRSFFHHYRATNQQRWSRGHKARDQGQGHKKIRGQGQGQPFRGQTLSRPRTGMLEAKAKDQGHKRKCSPKKKRSSQKFFRRSQKKKKKKRSLQKFFKRSPQKNVFYKTFHALHKILTIQKIVLSSSRGQANFRGLEVSRPRPRT